MSLVLKFTCFAQVAVAYKARYDFDRCCLLGFSIPDFSEKTALYISSKLNLHYIHMASPKIRLYDEIERQFAI